MSEKRCRKKEKMLNLRDIMTEMLSLPEEIVKKNCKITMLDNDKIMIEGFKSIIDFNSEYISIAGNNIEISMYGRNLNIQEVSNIDLFVKGEIKEVYFKKVGDN
ncbi:MAG: YabP/YqfC family sporulation protein [Clostridia bacterium]